MQADPILENDLATGRLIFTLTGYEAPSRPMHILFSASRRQQRILCLFIDLVAAIFN